MFKVSNILESINLLRDSAYHYTHLSYAFNIISDGKFALRGMTTKRVSFSLNPNVLWGTQSCAIVLIFDRHTLEKNYNVEPYEDDETKKNNEQEIRVYNVPVELNKAGFKKVIFQQYNFSNHNSSVDHKDWAPLIIDVLKHKYPKVVIETLEENH